jgi:hypothetical protein
MFFLHLIKTFLEMILKIKDQRPLSPGVDLKIKSQKPCNVFLQMRYKKEVTRSFGKQSGVECMNPII